MSQHAISSFPNYNLKVVKSNKFNHVDFLDCIYFKHSLKGLELDVMMILIHFQLNCEEEFIYFNTDDILEFRNKKKKIYMNFSRAGYSEIMRENIFWAVWNLKTKGYIDFFAYNKYNFEAKVLLDGEKYKINSKLLQLNPYKQQWQKMFGYFLEKNKDKKQIQVKKFLENVSLSSLAPYQIRDRFEQSLDFLCELKIIAHWRYKKIDENEFKQKGWLKQWECLSVYIYN